MSSSLIIEVCLVDDVLPHPNADRVELIRVKNWTVVSAKDQFKKGQKCIYVPPESVIPSALAERWGITKYCVPLRKQIDGTRPDGLRVKAQRFRGEKSFGTVQKPDEDWPVGMSVAEHYGIVKYEPPMRTTDGDAAPPVLAFHEYTGIENINNFPNIFQIGEEVIFTEKAHGMSSRAGCVFHPDAETGEGRWQWMSGSHAVRRKEFNQKGIRSLFWHVFNVEEKDCVVRKLLTEVRNGENAKSSVILFSEVVGESIQDMAYGRKKPAFLAFDISVDGKYLDYDRMMGYLAKYPEIETVPLLYRGSFSWEKVNEFTDGLTTICDPAVAGKFKGREGIVIKPIKERVSFDLPEDGRVILKSVSIDYYERKGGSEFH